MSTWQFPTGRANALATWSGKRDAIRRLPAGCAVDDETLRSKMELRSTDRLKICYAPLDYVRRGAPIAVVGLTPGRHTFRAAVSLANQSLRDGATDAVVLRRAKEAAPFSDPGTRARLIRWLDDLGVPAAIGLDSCSELYDGAAKMVHWTSLIRYPVFKWDSKKQAWQNYPGSPDPLRHFEDLIRGAFVPEVRQLRAAAIFTLGDKVRDTAERLVATGDVDGSRLVALPHPSGANVGNDNVYAQRRSTLKAQVRRLLRESSRGVAT